MSYFPFTFLFNVPGLSNPFRSSLAPATSDGQVETSIHPNTKSLKRNFGDDGHSLGGSPQTQTQSDSSRDPAHLTCKRPLTLSDDPGYPPARLVRKRGWQPSFAQLARPALVKPSTSGELDSAIELRDMSSDRDKRNDDYVELDVPPAKRRKGLAESVISTAFNAALVGAAVGMTVFRLWKDRGKESEQPPPPPYQEEWANLTKPPIPEPEVQSQPTSRIQRTYASAPKRHGTSVRHRQKAARKTVHIRKDKELSPRKKLPQLQHDEHPASATRTASGDDVLDEMDWIGGRLAQLIEEGKRALGAEVVVASESPEDEVDDGNGNWVEEDPVEESASFSSSRPILSSNPSKRFRHQAAYSVPSTSAPRLSTHSRFYSDDLTASLQSTAEGSSLFMPNTYDAESPAIRESMERARAAYMQKRGLGLGFNPDEQPS